ncbi:MAG: PD-(D/E)XK nuclease family protein [Myxococcota bacterium]|nr:PD-(D/E)XK nuclease family protein [Myxococcota bacterium]
MRANLVDTLLRFAASRPAEEDPFTEVLAWILERDAFFASELTALLRRVAVRRGIAIEGVDTHPSVSTQVVVAGTQGSCSRYDLVLDWATPRLRIVIEVKVHAALTLSGTFAEPVEGQARHQVDEYLAIARASGQRSLVFTLAPGALPVGDAARADDLYGGHLLWQDVHDTLRRAARSRIHRTMDPVVRAIAEQTLEAMERRSMAAPRITFEALLSVKRYAAFRQSFDPMLTFAWSTLHDDGTLAGFQKIDRRAWQQDVHDRMGYRLWAERKDPSAFGFMGIALGDDTMVEGVPDLYFFLEVPPRSRAQEAIDAHGAEILAAVARLAGRDSRVTWGYDPGGYESIWAARSCADIVTDPEPREALTAFFRSAVTQAREEKLLGIYFEAVAQSPAA